MQFTVHTVNEEAGEVVLTGIFRTDGQGYKDFCNKLHDIEAAEYIAMETYKRLLDNENIKRFRQSNNCINKKGGKDCVCKA